MKFFRVEEDYEVFMIAEDEEEVLKLLEEEGMDVSQVKNMKTIGENSMNVVLWESDMNFDDYIEARRAVIDKDESGILLIREV